MGPPPQSWPLGAVRRSMGGDPHWLGGEMGAPSSLGTEVPSFAAGIRGKLSKGATQEFGDESSEIVGFVAHQERQAPKEEKKEEKKKPLTYYQVSMWMLFFKNSIGELQDSSYLGRPMDKGKAGSLLLGQEHKCTKRRRLFS